LVGGDDADHAQQNHGHRDFKRQAKGKKQANGEV